MKGIYNRSNKIKRMHLLSNPLLCQIGLTQHMEEGEASCYLKVEGSNKLL